MPEIISALCPTLCPPYPLSLPRCQVNPDIKRDKWEPEEDALLLELVKAYGVGRWAEIARQIDGRTDQQCMGRWRRHLDPSIRRVGGRWQCGWAGGVAPGRWELPLELVIANGIWGRNYMAADRWPHQPAVHRLHAALLKRAAGGWRIVAMPLTAAVAAKFDPHPSQIALCQAASGRA